MNWKPSKLLSARPATESETSTAMTATALVKIARIVDAATALRVTALVESTATTARTATSRHSGSTSDATATSQR